MADSGKIYIYVTNQAPGGYNPDSPVPQENREDSYTEEGLSPFDVYAINSLVSIGKELGKNAVKVYVAQPGWNGDYITQIERQNVVNALNILSRYGRAAISGAKIGGVYGAAIAVGIQGISDVIGIGYELKQIQITSMKTNYAIELNRKRSGLDTLTNGSRGTRD